MTLQDAFTEGSEPGTSGAALLANFLRLNKENSKEAFAIFQEVQKVILGMSPPNGSCSEDKLTLVPVEIDCPCSILSTHVDDCYSNAIQLAIYINKELEPFGIQLCTSKIEQHLKAPTASKEVIAKQFVRDPSGNISGRIYETTARAFVDAIKVILSPRKRHTSLLKAVRRAFKILIRGACQSGKMCIISMLYFMLPPLIYTATERQVKTVSVLNLVQYISLQSHSLKEMRGFHTLYGDLIIKSKTCAISVNDYIAMQKRDGSFLSDEEQEEKCVVIRSSRGIKIVAETLNVFISKGYLPIVFTDECHFGSEKNGGQDRLLASIPQNVAQIAISATADEVLSRNVKANWSIVDLPLGKDYVGPGFYDGHRLPSTADYVEILPENMEINDWLRVHGISASYPYSRKAYSSIIGYYQLIYNMSKKQAVTYYNTHRDACNKEHSAYRHNFEQTTLEMFKVLFDRTESITIRAFQENTATKIFMENLEAIRTAQDKTEQDNFILAPFFREQGKINGRANVKEYLAGFSGQKVVLFVTADARMGCAFPASNNVFIDLTEAKSYTNTVIQGLYGRACGYNKIYNGKVPLVLLSEVSQFTIESLKRNKWRWKHGVKNPGPRTILCLNITQRKLHSRVQNIHLLLDQNNPLCREITDTVRFAFKMADRLHRTDLRGKIGRKNTLLWNSILKNHLLTTKFLEHTVYEIDPSLKRFRFLKLGETDPFTGCLYDVTTNDNQDFQGVFGIRTTKGFGTVSRNTRRKSGLVVEPQLSIELVPGVSCPICLTPCTATKLYDLKNAYCAEKKNDGGHWPSEALTSCCWQNAEIICTSIHLRIAEYLEDEERSNEEESDFEAKFNSVYNDELEDDELEIGENVDT